jgi:DNA-binding transcriptional ArsR family regulator
MPTEEAIYAAIADPTRRKILERLAHQEVSVRNLAEPFAMSRAAISQHLAVILAAGLVDGRKVGRERLYRLRPEPLRAVRTWLDHLSRSWPEQLQALGDYLNTQDGDQA